MLTAWVWLAATAPAPTSDGVVTTELISQVIAPIVGTGLVGSLFLMVLFRIKIMPTYVHDDAKAEWLKREQQLLAEVAELKESLKDSNRVYTEQVIPTLTRVLDSERELVDLRREEAVERRRRGHDA